MIDTLFLDPTIILLIAAFAGFFMAFGIGANDVANAMGTSVGSKALTFTQAIFIAAIFEFLGAYLAGGEVTSTIRKEIVSPYLYIGKENIFIIGIILIMLSQVSIKFIEGTYKTDILISLIPFILVLSFYLILLIKNNFNLQKI